MRRYNRVARFYSTFEPLFLILPRTRRAAVRSLALQPGDAVVEFGAGTGRNLPYLIEAVGDKGIVIAVDAAAGMLDQARRLIERHGWRNVQLVHDDAAAFELTRDGDGILFSLSYSVIPRAQVAAARAWQRLRLNHRLVVMDAGLTHARFASILRPLVAVLLRLGPGDPDATPWSDLKHLGDMDTRWLLGGLCYVCTWTEFADVTKPRDSAG